VVNLFTEGFIDSKNKVVYNSSFGSPFLLQLSLEGGEETQSEPTGDSGNSGFPPVEDVNITEEEMLGLPYCGDGICQSDEDVVSCPSDCAISAEPSWVAKIMLGFICLSVAGIFSYYYFTKRKKKKGKISLKW